MFQPIQQNKIMGIKSNGLRYGLEHREKEAQLLSLSIQGAADYGQGRRQIRKSNIILFGGLQTHLAYLRRLFPLYWGGLDGDTWRIHDGHTYSSLATNLPYVA